MMLPRSPQALDVGLPELETVNMNNILVAILSCAAVITGSAHKALATELPSRGAHSATLGGHVIAIVQRLAPAARTVDGTGPRFWKRANRRWVLQPVTAYSYVCARGEVAEVFVESQGFSLHVDLRPRQALLGSPSEPLGLPPTTSIVPARATVFDKSARTTSRTDDLMVGVVTREGRRYAMAAFGDFSDAGTDGRFLFVFTESPSLCEASLVPRLAD